MRSPASTLARLLFALPFALLGMIQFANAEALGPRVPVFGGALWLYVTGAILVVASLGLATMVGARWCALALALLSAAVVLAVDVPALGMADLRAWAMTGLLRDVALCGGALTWASVLRREERREDASTSIPKHTEGPVPFPTLAAKAKET